MISLYKNNNSLRVPEAEEDVDPMSSVANIADAMLVFACGLMVALVVAWEVDLSSIQEVELQNSEAIEDVETLKDILSSDGSSYIQRGMVYQDPKTGTMYLLEDDAQGGDSGSASGDSEASSGGQSDDAGGSGTAETGSGTATGASSGGA